MTLDIKELERLHTAGTFFQWVETVDREWEAILDRLKAAEDLVAKGVPSYRAYTDDDNHHCAYCYGIRTAYPDTFEHETDCVVAALIRSHEEAGNE